MWGMKDEDLSGRLGFLRKEEVMEHGVRNLISCMPTASTSQILGIMKHLNLIHLIYIRVVYWRVYCSKQAFIERFSRLGLWNETLNKN
jgi:ribonucleotide reductase alpha subunit